VDVWNEVVGSWLVAWLVRGGEAGGEAGGVGLLVELGERVVVGGV